MSKIKQILIATTIITVTIIGLTFPQTVQAKLGDIVLRAGMSNNDVAALQNNLNSLGYNAGAADGIFGSQTLSAVKGFQSHNELAVDGIVGGNTVSALLQQMSGSNYQEPSRGGFNRGLISYTAQEIRYLAQLVYGEARGEPFVGQVAVAAVVLNRVNSKQFDNTIAGVIFEPGAFTAVSDKQFYLEPDETAYKAAREAISGWDPTGNAIYYWNPETATNKWVWTRQIITQIGRHVFAK